MTERSSEPFADREPPPELRQRLTRTLRREGLVEPPSARLRRPIIQGAIAAALVAGAFLAGQHMQRSTATDARPQFLLLLYEDSAYRDDRPIREIVAEYGGWADSLRRERALVLGEKLGREHIELPERADQQTGGLPTGMFIVRATDLASARTIASSSPHIRQGGRIVVHAIDH